jgi:DNA-binding PadR family transcriptional regulator
MGHYPLGEFEHAVLLATLQLDDDVGTSAIREYLEQQMRRAVARGALYTTLDRLETKGLVRSRMGGATAERGGRPRRLYAVTPAGVGALREARAALLIGWRGLESRVS